MFRWNVILIVIVGFCATACVPIERRLRQPESKHFLETMDFSDESLNRNKSGNLLFTAGFYPFFYPDRTSVGIRIISQNKAEEILIERVRLLSKGFQTENELGISIQLSEKFDDVDLYHQSLWVIENIPKRDIDKIRKNISLEIDFVTNGEIKTKSLNVETFRYHLYPI